MNNRLPSADRTIALGCSSTQSSPIRVSDAVENAWMRDPPQSDTYTVLPSADTTHVYGSAGSDTVFTT